MMVGGPRAVGHLASVSSSVDISLLLQVMDQQPPVFTSPGYGESLSHGIYQRVPCDLRLMHTSHVSPMFLDHIIRCLGILPDFNGFWVGLSATSSQLTAALSAPPSSFQRPIAANDTTALRWTDNSAASGGPGASVLQVRISHPSSLCIPPASNQTVGYLISVCQ